jgi:hypothetical protein
VELGLKDVNETIEAQCQVTEIQQTLTDMQQVVVALQASVDCQQHR